MADSTKELQIIIRARDEATKVIAGIGSQLSDIARKAEAGAQIITATLTAVTVGALKTAGNIETSRQGFIGLLGSVEAANAAIDKIQQDAAKTPFTFPGLLSANQLLTQVTKNADQSESFLLNIGKALATAGKGQPELDRIIANLQQIGNTAKITEMDVRQFGFNGINVLELLADYYGTTKEKAGEMVKDSKDAFGDLEKAFAKAGGAGGQFEKAYENQFGTLNQLISNFGDNVGIALNKIATETGLFDAAKKIIADFSAAIVIVTPYVIEFMKVFQDNIPAIIGLLAALGTLLVVATAPILASIAAAIALAAAFGAIAFGISYMIEQIMLGNPLFIGIGAALATVTAIILTGLIPAFIGWAAVAVPAAIATTIAMAPIILVAALVGAAIALLAVAWQNNFLGIRDVVQSVIKYISDDLKKWWDLFKQIVDWLRSTAWPWIKETFDNLRNTVAQVTDSIISRFNNVRDAIQGVINKIGDLVSKAADLGGKVAGGLKIPGFQHGGFVPGSYDQAVPAILHGGERVTPKNGLDVNPGGGGGGVTVNMNGPVSMDSTERVQELAETIISMLGRQNELAAKGFGV